MVADPQADRETEATSHVNPQPGDESAPNTGPGTGPATGPVSGPVTSQGTGPDTDTGTAGDAARRPTSATVDTPADELAGTVAAPVAESLPDGPLGARVAAIAGLSLAARPDAFAELDAAIVAELRAIEDL